MAINTYSTLKTGFVEWMARTGDTDLATRFDDFLALCEQRMWYGKAAMPTLGVPTCEPLRIREMEQVSASFSLSGATVAQPTGFLELISAQNNSDSYPIDIVTEAVIDSYNTQSLGGVKLMAVSGANFRFKDTPDGSGTATLRYFKKLDTPTSDGTVNWVISNASGVYLNGVLLEAAIYTLDPEAAKMYAAAYAADVQSLNERRNRELWSAHNVRLRIRGSTP